ncbi:hypothetical protein ABZV58_27925 [Nocardia sp. NPDC004654]|uniref:hypothetical protein n=1 Tax=Nocardia sp. NPDC004654 TaxID=3154776 RepID=UPI00339FB04C
MNRIDGWLVEVGGTDVASIPTARFDGTDVARVRRAASIIEFRASMRSTICADVLGVIPW